MPSKRNDISFDFTTLQWDGITVDQVKFWEQAYPDVDVIAAITKKMPAWLDANPEKSHKKKWKRFIVNWLSAQQERYEQFRVNR
jgi:hypothetical protein